MLSCAPVAAASPYSAASLRRPPGKLDLQDEHALFHSWARRVHLNVGGFAAFLLYLAATTCYLGARAAFSLRGLHGGLFAYGAVVLAAEAFSAVSLAFYGIWLCARTDQADVRGAEWDAKLRRLYTIRVFILCKDEPLALVRRTIASVRNAYATDGCERVLYLLDSSRDPAKRDFFMAGDASAADVIYIAAPPRPGPEKVPAGLPPLAGVCMLACTPQPTLLGTPC